MKFSDIIIETKKQQITEKPMGFLKTMGNKVASTFGSGQAQGRLDTGKEANTLRKDFDIFLGKTGQNPTGDLVLQFLQQKGYPTKSAQNFISAAKPQAAPAAEPVATTDPATPPAADQTKPADAAAATTPAQPTKDEIAARVKANVGKTAAATKASGFGQPVEKPKPDAGAAAFGQMAQQLSNPQEKPAVAPDTTAPATPTPATDTPSTAKPGFLKTATDKIQDRAGAQELDAIKAKPGFQRTASDKLKLKAAGIKESFAQRLNFYLLLEEVLSGKQLDQIFLAAAQEKAKGGGTATSTPGQPSGQQPAAAGDQPGAQLQQEPGASKSAGSGSSFMKHAAAAYDGMRGASYGATKVGGDSAGLALKDTSGRIPSNIMGQLNQLTDKQRAQLRKELDKA